MKIQNFFVQHVKNNVFKYIMSVVFFSAGVFIGITALTKLELEQGRGLVEYFSSSDKNVDFINIFKKSTFSNLKWVAAYFVMSLSVYASWLSLMFVGVKGFFAGFTSAFLITNYAEKGITYVLLAITPSSLLVIPVYAFLSATCINFATAYKKEGKRGSVSRFSPVPALVAIFFVMMVCSLYDVIVAPFVFSRLFG